MFDPSALSEALRTEGGWILWCRRGIVITSFVAALCMMFIGLYQMGIIGRLPEPPLPRMNAEKVDAAPQAYSPMGIPMPDAFLGLFSYAVTAMLAVIAGPKRWETLWWLPLLLAVKVLIDAFQAGRLSYAQWADHRAFCFWCLVAATATFAAVPLAIPEAYLALKRLF
jgi:uncharacterized membrane protein